MKVSCLQENLAKGLSIVGRAVAARSTLPVLGNILLATDNGRLKLSATNLEIGITCWIRAQTLHLRSGRFENNVKGIDAQEFPIIPQFEEDGAIRVAPDVLKKMID